MKKFFLFSLGCKVNSYELASIAHTLNERGYIEDKNDPDVVIINTCSVTATADQKSRQHIRKFKTMYPNAVIVVMGCYSQKAHAFIYDELKADIVTGTSGRVEVLDLIEDAIKNKKRVDITESKPRFFSYEEMGLASCSENVRAYLKIQDGCDNFCSYCLIPFVRGKCRSREISSIIEEAKYLISKGYKEIVLTGIHVGGYGRDLSNISFSDLVEQLLSLEGLYRLRISSIEESEIDDKLISLLIHNDRLAKHLHIPLQSGNNETLRRMNRKYTIEQFYEKVSKIKKEVPDFALTTDVIVGFPQESEEEFNGTFEFIKKMGFDMLHVFPFSSREGTIASKMEGQIAPDIKKQRAHILIEHSNKVWNQYSNKYIGKETEILIEKLENGIASGHTSNYLELKFPVSKAKVGDIVRVKIEKDMIISK